MEALILVRYGEIALKGHNRPQFENLLADNILRAVKPLGGRILKHHGRMYVTCGESQLAEVMDRLGRVFGIVSYSPGVAVALDMDAIRQAAQEQLQKAVDNGARTFKVECRRPNKGFPHKSPEISADVGASS